MYIHCTCEQQRNYIATLKEHMRSYVDKNILDVTAMLGCYSYPTLSSCTNIMCVVTLSLDLLEVIKQPTTKMIIIIYKVD